MKTLIGIILALIVATLALASCSSPETAVSEPKSSPVGDKSSAPSSTEALPTPEVVVVAKPSEPTVDISSVDQLSSDVDVDSLGKLDEGLKELEDLS